MNMLRPIFHEKRYNVSKFVINLLGQLFLSVDNLCKQLGPRSGPTKCWASSGSKLLEVLMELLKEFVEKLNFEIITGNFACFCCCLLTFFKINFFKKFFQVRVSNRLEPDQDQHSVSPDLVPNCLQRLSADNKSHH